MVIISAGMQKSGSGWYFNLTNDLLISAGYSDVREIRKKYSLESILEYYNCNIGELTEDKIELITSLPLNESIFVVKTHSGPFDSLNKFISNGIVKATYIHRDPRDVVLSVLDHGERIRKQGENHFFGKIKTFEEAVLWVKTELFPIWDEWNKLEDVLLVRYEDLLKIQ